MSVSRIEHPMLPYSLDEVEFVLKQHRGQMDDYHWELMLWMLAQLRHQTPAEVREDLGR